MSTQIWINHPEADPIFIQAAATLERWFFTYRTNLLTDSALRSNLIERAVVMASRGTRGRRIANPTGYLCRVFSNLVGREIRRMDRFVPLDPVITHPTLIDDTTRRDVFMAILTSQALSAMSPSLRRACLKLSDGATQSEVAADIGITEPCFNKRLNRFRARFLAGTSGMN
jgi:DNA-directed RNA polymerase specialized sigma24 family protein